MGKYFNIIIFFFLGFVTGYSQENPEREALLKKVESSFTVLDAVPEKANQEAQLLEKEGRSLKEADVELPALVIQCIYYRGKNDFEKMMAKAKLLSKRAKSYKADAYQIMAKRYLFEAYYFSGLPEKAFRELEQGRELAAQLQGKDSLNIISKGDLYISFSNYYAAKGDNKNQLDFLNLAGREFEQMPNKEYKEELLHIHYSNLAAAYNEINELDSAKHHIALSQELNNNFNQHNTNITNLWVMGSVALKEKNYQHALNYFKEAEKLEGYKNHINIRSLYDNIILCYQELMKADSARIYEIKKDSLKLSITENQNKSLHQLLKEKEDNSNPYLYLLVFLFILMGVVIFLITRKNKTLARQEQESQKYLATFSENQARHNYSQLLQMLEQRDPAFMNYFDEMFPGFSKKLLEINPQIVQTEIEFCSLLKLKIPTKDIARYKYITPKTVQNKKYLIRKKLNIPKEIDIYQWFDGV